MVQEMRDGTLLRPASRVVRLLAWGLAVATVAFAIVNVVFEVTGRFEGGRLSEYASGLSIANWFVAGLKVLGASVAVLSTTRQSWISPRAVNILIWGAAGTLGVYSLGSVGQAVAMTTGFAGSRTQIGPASTAYLLAFLLAATGFVVLAISHSRRSNLGAGPAIVGSLGGTIVLGIILVALPMLLAALGIMPSG